MYELVKSNNRVLIVEDERLIATLIENYLIDLGYEVSGICTKGEEAIRKLSDTPVDIVLMDVKLGGELDGIQTTKTISKLYKLPVIFITAYTDPRTFYRAKLSSTYGWLTKPINKNDLKINIELALYKHHILKVAQENEEKYRLLFNSTNDLVFVNHLDKEHRIGRFIEVNHVMCRLTGYGHDELMNIGFIDLIEESRLPEYLEFIKKLKEERSFLFETEIASKLKKKMLVEVNSYQFRFKNEEAILSIARDITERRHLEIQLLQSQKMEAIGRLSGGIAHDFNNFLTVVLGNVDLLLTRLKPDDKNYKPILNIKEASERTSKIVKQLLSMSKVDQYESIDIDINDLLKKMHSMLDRLVPENVRFSLRLSPEIPDVSVDPSRIESVILNLFINALDALGNGGELIISTERKSGKDLPEIVDRIYNISDSVTIKVQDTGEGIPNEMLENIFDPFFTTKKHGTGLGLSSVYGIVHQIGGHISVDSKVGFGTEFSIYLPPSRTEASKSQENKAKTISNNLPGGNECIFIIEDERTLLEFTQEFLSIFGYRVLVADNGDDAWQIIEQQGSEIDLMLIDVVLPGISSIELINFYEKVNPRSRIICMSGYGDGIIDREGLGSKGHRLIKKPFSSSYLVTLIRETLDK